VIRISEIFDFFYITEKGGGGVVFYRELDVVYTLFKKETVVRRRRPLVHLPAFSAITYLPMQQYELLDQVVSEHEVEAVDNMTIPRPILK